MIEKDGAQQNSTSGNDELQAITEAEKKKLDTRLVELERQVRQEMDFRIIAMMVEYQRLANDILTPKEVEICTDYMGLAIQNPAVKFQPGVAAVFDKLHADSLAKELFDRLQSLISAKLTAQDIRSASLRSLKMLLSKQQYEDMQTSNGAILRHQSEA